MDFNVLALVNEVSCIETRIIPILTFGMPHEVVDCTKTRSKVQLSWPFKTPFPTTLPSSTNKSIVRSFSEVKRIYCDETRINGAKIRPSYLVVSFASFPRLRRHTIRCVSLNHIQSFRWISFLFKHDPVYFEWFFFDQLSVVR